MPEHRTRAQERAEEIDISPTKLLGDIETLKAELDEARKEPEEYLGALQRERAEFLNFRRRTTEERQRDAGLAGEDLIRKVLTVADDFDRAIEARPDSIATHPWFEGIAAIDRKLRAPARERGRQLHRRDPGSAVRSARARGDRQRRPAPAGRRARSSRRSGAAIGSATASCARPSWPSPARPTTNNDDGHGGGGTDGPAPINGHAPH